MTKARTTSPLTKGSYVLLIELQQERTIGVGSLKTMHFDRGSYAYVGSAMGGLDARIRRHLRADKKCHWHIDYLLSHANIDGIILCRSEDRIECTIARALSRQFDFIPGFGSSDCTCRSHLFFAPDKRQMKPGVSAVISTLGIQPKFLTDSPLAR